MSKKEDNKTYLYFPGLWTMTFFVLGTIGGIFSGYYLNWMFEFTIVGIILDVIKVHTPSYKLRMKELEEKKKREAEEEKRLRLEQDKAERIKNRKEKNKK